MDAIIKGANLQRRQLRHLGCGCEEQINAFDNLRNAAFAIDDRLVPSRGNIHPLCVYVFQEGFDLKYRKTSYDGTFDIKYSCICFIFVTFVFGEQIKYRYTKSSATITSKPSKRNHSICKIKNCHAY